MKEVTSSTSILLPRLPSSSPSRLSRPGHTAPLRAFGPGSRSCDVISKASASTRDTRPCPQAPALKSCLLSLGGERGGEMGQCFTRLAAPAPIPTVSPRAAGFELPPTGQAASPCRPPLPPPSPKHPLPISLATRIIAILSYFAIPARVQNQGWKRKSCPSRPSRIWREKVHTG